MNTKHICLVLPLLTSACSPSDSMSHLKEAWNSRNAPGQMSGSTFEKSWSKLPLNGTAAQQGWSEDYWATYRGGISYRWQSDEAGYALETVDDSSSQSFDTQSPAEKFDLFKGRYDYPTVISERDRTQIMKTIPSTAEQPNPEFVKDFEIPTWEGLCHGWAPAALNFKEPQKAVTLANPQGHSVTFYPSDIKALLLYYQQYDGNRSTVTSFVAERCNTDFKHLDEQLNKGEISKEDWRSAHEGVCGDINPGSLHLIFTNEIGLKKQGFVADVTRDAEVWNQPVNAFHSKVLEETEGAGEGAAPGTVKEKRVRTQMDYTVEVDPSRDPSGTLNRTATYEYILELNAKDEIIGGRWVSEDRPDFVWRESKPQFSGYFKSLEDIYEQSIAP